VLQIGEKARNRCFSGPCRRLAGSNGAKRERERERREKHMGMGMGMSCVCEGKEKSQKTFSIGSSVSSCYVIQYYVVVSDYERWT
jgi:CO/xanthine dehydrogenase Mo-binding subunit